MPDDNNKPTRFVGYLWETVSTFFVSMFESVWGGFLELIPHIWHNTYNWWHKWLGKGEDVTWDAMLNMFISAGMITRETATDLLKLKDATTPLDDVFYFWLFFSLTTQYITQAGYAAGGKARQQMNAKYGPEPPGPRDVMMAAFIAPEKTGEVRDAMKRAGLSDKDIDLMFVGAYRLYNEMDIRNLWLRGVLDKDQMFMRMRELGYTDTRIKEIIQGWPLIPGPQDLLTMVAHEAFEPDMISLLGLSDEFPEDQVEWLQKQGISREWALRYWYSHWEEPSIQAGYEMLHRGVINKEQLDMLYRTVEIPPFWRDKLTAIAYQPYTRVDVRRMYNLGVLGDDELLKSYMDLGYDLEHAVNMSKFTVAYNQSVGKKLTKSQIIEAYRDKGITRQDAVELLIALEYSEDQSEFLLILEDYKEAKTVQSDLLKNIEGQFKNNLIDEFVAKSKLGQLNLSAVKINSLVEKWKLTQYLTLKRPGKADLDRMLIADIISEDIWRDEMRKTGYGYEYTTWYWKLLHPKEK